MTVPTVRVLLVEDQDQDALVIQALLENLPGTPVVVDRVSTAAEALATLAERRHEVCLLDYMLGEETGIDVLSRARARAVRTPVLVLTGKGSRSVDLETMNAGAVDYLEKQSLEPEVLERAIRYAIQRHRALEELRRSEERNRGMFDHLPLGLFRVSLQGEYLEANPALIRLLEHPDRSTLRDRMARHFFVAEGDHPRLLHLLQERGEVIGFETQVNSARGRLLRLRISARVHGHPEGAPEYVEGTVEDLTGSPSAQELEEDAACFRTLAGIVPLGLLRVDQEGQIRWANTVAQEELGESLGQLEGRGIWTLVHPTDQERVALAFEEIAGGSRDRCVRDVLLLRPDGTQEARTLTLAAVAGRGGNLQSLLAAFSQAAPRRENG
jgi:PAS domain S-box-containing protein